MTGLADKQQAHPGGLLKDFSGDARDIFGEGAPLRHPHPRFLFSTAQHPLRNRTAVNLVRIALINGAIAQLVERCNRTAEVSGSTPLSSTELVQPGGCIRPVCFLSRISFTQSHPAP